MDWEQGAVVAQIVSSIAVLVTLIYLAIQTRQTHYALNAASRQGIMLGDVQLLAGTVSSVDVASLLTKDAAEMTPGESFAVGSWCAGFVRVREFAWFQYRAGILDETTWRSYIGPARRILGLPSLRPWWEQFREEIDPEFRAWLDREISI